MDHVWDITRLWAHTHRGRNLLSGRRGRSRSTSHEGESKLSRSLVRFSGNFDCHSHKLVLLLEVDCVNKCTFSWIGCIWSSISVDNLKSSQVSFTALFPKDVDLLNRLLLHVDWFPVVSFHAQHLWFLTCSVGQFETCKVLITSAPSTEGYLWNFHIINILASL